MISCVVTFIHSVSTKQFHEQNDRAMYKLRVIPTLTTAFDMDKIKNNTKMTAQEDLLYLTQTLYGQDQI